jgi:putative intracellular protease/amidase
MTTIRRNTGVRTPPKTAASKAVAQRQKPAATRAAKPVAAVAAARSGFNAGKIATELNGLAKGRLFTDQSTRIEQTRALFSGLSADQLAQVRAAYISKYDIDPELHIKSDGWGQPLVRLDRATETEMLGALNGPQFTKDAATLHSLLDKANAGTLTQKDRQAYFAMMPRIGLWDAPVRAKVGDKDFDAQERTLIERSFGPGFDAALKKIESAMPAADLAPRAPREKSIAVIASSHGAQWQELMGWAKKMDAKGYSIQIFTPEGRPVAMQRDSLSVFKRSSGFGSPVDLDPAGATGEVAAKLLGNTAAAKDFNAKNFGAVYLAGGLGFNEDVAVAMPDKPLRANPNIEKMMNAAVGERLPVIAICHAPTLLAATTIEVNGKKEPINKGIETASLPPFEGFVGLTGRKELQFTFDVNTHRALSASGGETHVLKDIANMSRVVKEEKAGLLVYTGPGPQAAANLADATLDALKKRWR